MTPRSFWYKTGIRTSFLIFFFFFLHIALICKTQSLLFNRGVFSSDSMRFILKYDTRYALVVHWYWLTKGAGTDYFWRYSDTYIAIKIKETIKYSFPAIWNQIPWQTRNDRLSSCKANIPIPIPIIVLSILFFSLLVGPNPFLSGKKVKMLKAKFNMIDSIVQENQEVNLMINFLLQLKLNLNISLSCLQVYSFVKDWICNQLWVFKTMFWAKWISKYLQPDRLMYVSRKPAACLIHSFSLLHFAYIIVPDFFLEENKNALLN